MKRNTAFLGAAFLMATSAIGPGFLTQTSRFTEELLASFGFVIFISLLLDIGVQLNIWRLVTVTNKRAQDLANDVLPGLGWMLAGLIGFGGWVFNIGNIAGCGLGLQALTGLDVRMGAILSCIISLAIFWNKEAGKLIDGFVKILGIAMIIFTVYIAISSAPPIGEALYRTIWPEKVDAAKIVTLVGGTVGGYISFAGAHRLLDAGIHGKQSVRLVDRGAIRGIAVTTVMRYILFLAALGVVSQGFVLGNDNPAGAVFKAAAGTIGFRFFGFVMWCAAITSVIGASYTSISFFKTLHPALGKNNRVMVSAFITTAALTFLFLGNPVTLLILAGAVNGLILPVALTVILISAQNRKITAIYHHPLWMQVAGWLVVLAMSWMGISTLQKVWEQFYSG